MIERLCEPERQIIFRVPWVDDDGDVQRQPRLPRAVQPRARPVQGRPAVPPQREPRHRQVPRLRADLQERPHRPADRRRQGWLRLRPQGPVRRRDHAVLPVVHDRALPPHRRVHRRAGRRHRRRRPRDRLPVRPVQADHQPLRVRRAHRQGPAPGAARRCAREATGYGVVYFVAEMLRSRGRVLDGKTRRRLGSGNVAIYAIEKVHQLGGTVGRLLRLLRVRRRREGHRPRPAEGDQGGRPRPRSASTPTQRAARASSSDDGSRLGRALRRRAPVRHPERARRGPPPRRWSRTACTAVAEGANMPTTPEARPAVPRGRGGRSPRARRPTPAASRPVALEMQQNASRDSWDFEYTEERLAEIMRGIHDRCLRRRPTSTARRATTSPARTSPASSRSPTRCSRSASSSRTRGARPSPAVAPPCDGAIVSAHLALRLAPIRPSTSA